MIKTIHYYIWLCMMSLFVLVGCDVHELPEESEEQVVPFLLNLDFDTEMPLYKEITYSRNGSKGVLAPYDIRYIINVYRTDEVRGESRVADMSYTITNTDLQNLNYSVQLELKEGSYTFRVWADYVDEGSESDKFYNTEDFAEIILADRKNHVGSNEYREAFRGFASATVDARASASENQVTVEMKRPMGKFKFVSTDVEAFYSRVVKELMEKRGLLKENESEADSKAVYDQLLQSIDINDFKVVIRYNAFMPCSFNMFTDKPADSWTGMSFDSRMIAENENEMSLGYDYIFVNGSETTLSISVEIYNTDGELMSSSNPVDVPIVRNKLTVVKGAFLTSKASGGVSINPGYDGDDYNIEIK